MEKVKRNKFLIGSVVLIAAIFGATYYFWYTSHYETTDDATLEGHVIPMSSQVAGQVEQVLVKENQPVKKDDVLVVIDPAPFEIKLKEEKAKLASALAEQTRTASDRTRYSELYKKDEASKQQLDDALARAASAEAVVERERAVVQQAELDLSNTKITAPESGLVTKKSIEPGAYVQVGQSLMAIVPEEIWVIANFKETQLTDMKPGQPAVVKVDAYPSLKFRGHVDSIQAGTGSRFSLFPPENATGNFVKVVQRVPVKIVLDPVKDVDPFLAPGMSVVATVKDQ